MTTSHRTPAPGTGWRLIRTARELPHVPGRVSAAGYRRGTVLVISDLVVGELPTGNASGPQWLLSVSRSGRRARPGDIERALRDFGMLMAEQDNHEPGIHKCFWLPVDPAHRVDCECKVTEDLVIEPDGHTWSNPKPGHGECRGCKREHLLMLGPCTIHTTRTARVVSREETPNG